MSRPLSIGQVWILEEMVKRGGGISEFMSTTCAPEPVRMAALRGLNTRGLCEEKSRGLFYITPAGRFAYADNRERLDAARAVLRRQSESRMKAEDSDGPQASDVAAMSATEPESKLCDHGNDRAKQFCEECRLDEDGEAEMPGGFNV